jgi:hypothetical protein
MSIELPSTIWLVYSQEAMRDTCVARFERAGAEVRPVRWDRELEDLIRRLHRDDWVLFDHDELGKMPPDFAGPFKQVLARARVMVVSQREVPADQLPAGWIELTAPITCAKICKAVQTLTGVACTEPGCCKR